MRIESDGIHLHQSDIETFTQCPEKKRLSILAGMNEETFQSDAAFVGTCMHGVIQHELENGPFDDLFSAQQYSAFIYLQGFEAMIADGKTVYSRETFGNDQKALEALARLVEVWWVSSERDMLMMMDPADMRVEWQFDRQFTKIDTDDGPLPIFLAGTADLVLPWAVWDWKSASSPYQRWEKQRWGVQPSVYTWAAADAGLIVPNKDEKFEFRFKVALRRMKPEPFQDVPIYRSARSYEWLERRVQNIVSYVMRVGLTNEWTLTDNSALCGPKWCPFWEVCKGKHIDADDDWS